MKSKVNLFGQNLRNCQWRCERTDECNYLKYPPCMITVARSSEDGFTPAAVVDNLQKAVLEEIYDVYCNCKINVVLDYGEYEGSSID